MNKETDRQTAGLMNKLKTIRILYILCEALINKYKKHTQKMTLIKPNGD